MNKKNSISTARTLAPEDIRPGDVVGILQINAEVFWPFGGDLAMRQGDPLLRFSYLPCGPVEPLEVISVCLPFVLVARPGDTHTTLDVRRCRLARLHEEFARKARKRLPPREPKPESAP